MSNSLRFLRCPLIVIFTNLPQTLNTIRLEENNWTYIDTNIFDSHDLRNITVISLSNNKLVNITISGHLKNLKELDISKNRLIRFFIPSTIDLHKLYLYDNNNLLFDSEITVIFLKS
jgi:Leucine-rich repeat (LRR) protein